MRRISVIGIVTSWLCVPNGTAQMPSGTLSQTPSPRIKLSAAGFVNLPFRDGGLAWPTWNGGYYSAVEYDGTSAPVIHRFDRMGRVLPRLAVSVPGAKVIFVHGVSSGPDGDLALCGVGMDSLGRASAFIQIVSADGNLAKTVKTFPYAAHLIARAPDGTIWTQGIEVDRGRERGPFIDPGRGMLRHFDQSGVLIGSFVPRSSRASNVILTNGLLSATDDRVGWYSVGDNRYVEVSNSGDVSEFPGVQVTSSPFQLGGGLVMSEQNDVLVGIQRYAIDKTIIYELFRLDRERKEWRIVQMSDVGIAGPLRHLVGGDSKTLVFADAGASGPSLRFFEFR